MALVFARVWIRAARVSGGELYRLGHRCAFGVSRHGGAGAPAWRRAVREDGGGLFSRKSAGVSVGARCGFGQVAAE
eukprot:11655214-Alexandrium_andersonii.AAC.1